MQQRFSVYLQRKLDTSTGQWRCNHVIVATGDPMPSGAQFIATFNTWAAAEAYCAQQAQARGIQLWWEWTC